MRLSEEEIAAIKKAVRTHFGASAKVYLFGSRTDDSKAGGDIDLLIEHEANIEGSRLVRAKLKTMTDIQFAIGDRKIDIVTVTLNQKKSEETAETQGNVPLIVREARKESIEL